MAEQVHFFDLSRERLRDQLAALGLPAYRADQVRKWVFERRVGDFAAMTNLSKVDRAMLAERIIIAAAGVTRHLQASDGVHKLLLTWLDKQSCETVLIPADDRLTACVSTQVGCPIGCRFCASGLDGLGRNLTAGEIVEEVWQLARAALAPEQRISHVVFMGTGEPLANYNATVHAVRLINASDGLNIGARRITISTVGLPAQMRKLAQEGIQVNLAVSLHAPNQGLREELIPFAAKSPLGDVLDAARYYFARTGREITFEYLLLAGVNDQPAHAEQLAKIVHSVRSSVNLITYNPVTETGFGRPDPRAVSAFLARLRALRVNAHARPSRGLDIDAACGQLRRSSEQE